MNLVELRQSIGQLSGSDREVCGAIVRGFGDSLLPIAVPNQSRQPEDSYFIPAATVLELELNYDVVGFYHSHPSGGCVPSDSDVEFALPGYIYVITAVDCCRAWRLREDRSGFDELEISDYDQDSGRAP
ncbi:MAG TPA: Mov34/MPN/PAD-1 family protein [Longimicrobiales bacterium]|nr:Mov34/MPN/PAD-1 family protein [Longimicrobiales bacterium]